MCSKAPAAQVLCGAVNGSLNATSKAALASKAVNGSGYAPYGSTPTAFLDNFLKQPYSWFNASNAYYAIDPPGAPFGYLCFVSCDGQVSCVVKISFYVRTTCSSFLLNLTVPDTNVLLTALSTACMSRTSPQFACCQQCSCQADSVVKDP